MLICVCVCVWEQELEKKKGKKEEPKLTKKQQDAMQAQLDTESKIRAHVRKVRLLATNYCYFVQFFILSRLHLHPACSTIYHPL